MYIGGEIPSKGASLNERPMKSKNPTSTPQHERQQPDLSGFSSEVLEIVLEILMKRKRELDALPSA
jgi:hypothetical protein